MDTLHRLFSGQRLGNKRLLLVVAAFVIIAGVARPLLNSSPRPRPPASRTPAALAPAQSQPASAPATNEKMPSLLDLESKDSPLFAPEPTSGPSLWRTLGSLAVVLALIVAGWFVFRRHLGGRMGPAGRRQVALLEATRVGSRQSVLLVQVGAKKFLLAATPERITLVADVTEACANDQPRV